MTAEMFVANQSRIALNSLDDVRALLKRGAQDRYDHHFNCAIEHGGAEDPCVIRSLRDGQKPQAIVVIPAGMDYAKLQAMKQLMKKPGAVFCVTPTSPYLVPHHEVTDYPHATWAALQYGVTAPKARTIILAGSNDAVFGDKAQCAGPSQTGVDKIHHQVTAYLGQKGITDLETIQELTARRVLIESAINTKRGFDGIPVKIVADYWDKSGRIINLNPDESVHQTYQGMSLSPASIDSENSAIDLIFSGCSDSRFLGQSFIPANHPGILYNNSIAAITLPYEFSRSGIVHPWKLITPHAQQRGARFLAQIGHEGCGGIEALIKHLLFGQGYPAHIQNWIALARSPAEKTLASMSAECDAYKAASNEHRRRPLLAQMADRVARSVTLWGVQNVKTQWSQVDALPLHAKKDGSVVELCPDDPSGQTDTPLFVAPRSIKHICGGHCNAGRQALVVS